MHRSLRCLAVAVTMSLAAAPVFAAGDPAAERAKSFCNALVDSVRQSKGQPVQARIKRLEPLVDDSFNIQVMAQFATAPAWANTSEPDRRALVLALARYSAARLAQEFDTYSGQSCAIDPSVQTRGSDKLVKTRILQPSATPVALNYRFREYQGAWKIVDLYYDGVSQLATERADFASVLQAKGSPGLVKRLNELTSNLR